MLKRYVMVELGQEVCEMLEEGQFIEQARESISYQIRCEHDGEIWEMVDSEDNSLELEFDDFLNEIVDEVISLGEYYYENNKEEEGE